MTKMRRFGTLAAGVVAFSGVLSYGTPYIGATENWSGGGTSGWLLEDFGNATVTHGGASDAGNNYLQLSFPDSGTPLDGILYANDGTYGDDRFTGNFLTAPIGEVNFRFNSFDATPSYLAVYFHSTTGQEWLRYVAAPAAGSGWASYKISINDYANWGLMGLGDGSAGAFVTDLATVDRFGFFVENGAVPNGQLFGLDDVSLSLTVPEPETVWLVLAALASLGITFRGKVGETARGLLKRT